MVTGIYSLLGVLVYAILFLFVTVPVFFLIGCALYSLDSANRQDRRIEEWLMKRKEF